jgi:hypothetical protein
VKSALVASSMESLQDLDFGAQRVVEAGSVDQPDQGTLDGEDGWQRQERTSWVPVSFLLEESDVNNGGLGTPTRFHVVPDSDGCAGAVGYESAFAGAGLSHDGDKGIGRFWDNAVASCGGHHVAGR